MIQFNTIQKIVYASDLDWLLKEDWFSCVRIKFYNFLVMIRYPLILYRRNNVDGLIIVAFECWLHSFIHSFQITIFKLYNKFAVLIQYTFWKKKIFRRRRIKFLKLSSKMSNIGSGEYLWFVSNTIPLQSINRTICMKVKKKRFSIIKTYACNGWLWTSSSFVLFCMLWW